MCDNFCNKRRVEIRKIDFICFRITGNTNFKKKLTSFVSKFAGEIELKVKIVKNSPTEPALKRIAYETGTNSGRYEFVIFAVVYMWPGRNLLSITWDRYKLKNRRFLELYNSIILIGNCPNWYTIYASQDSN